MNTKIRWAVALAGLAVCGQAVAGDAAAGQAKAGICAGCHGPTGISGNPLWPNLAGQKEAYLVKSMKDYRDGARQDVNMSAIVQTLSDADIDNLAAFFAAQSCD
jgi:cytochrome c553